MPSKAPDDLSVALRRTAWVELVKDSTGLHDLMGKFGALAADINDSDEVGARALRTLESICSFWPKHGDWGQPYVPMMQFDARRTMLPNDLEPDQLEMLRSVAGDIANPHLLGRIFDVLWLRWPVASERHIFARAAVEAWSINAVDDDSWDRSRQDELDRAASIARRLRFKDLETKIADSVLVAMRSSQSASLIARASNFLWSKGLAGESREEVMDQLTRATQLSATSPILTRALYSNLSRWQLANGDQVAGFASIKSVSDSWIAEAEARASGDNASFLVAADFLESALQQLRLIPRRLRTEEVVVLLGSLPKKIREHGLRGLEEMKLFESEPVDITAMVEGSRENAKGKSAIDALALLCALPLASFAKDRAGAEETNAGSIAGLFGNAQYAGDGRRTHKSTAADVDRYGVQAAVWRQMIMTYEIRIQLIGKGYVWPMLETISTEHHLQEEDFLTLVRESGFVPPERQELYARGLCDGFYSNFPSALHILTPQLEAVIRHHMQDAGLQTSGIDKDGIEAEMGLSKLLEDSKVETLLGEDLAYEIRALFCGPVGPNLRNAVAHGLVTAGQAFGIQSIYVWWLCFRLAFVPYFNRLRSETDNENS